MNKICEGFTEVELEGHIPFFQIISRFKQAEANGSIMKSAVNKVPENKMKFLEICLTWLLGFCG